MSNLRAFGLALVAMLAFGGIAAQGASAVVEHSFNSASADTVLTGKTESYSSGEASIEVLTATPGRTVECYGTYEGTNADLVRDTVVVHPTYSSCLNGASVHTNSCKYVFDSDTTTSTSHFSATDEHAAVSLDCGHSDWIEVTQPGCNITFGDTHSSTEPTVNQSLHGVRYDTVTDSSKHALTVTATVRTIKYIVTSGSFCGLAGHPAGTYSNGKLDVKVEVTGYEASTHTAASTTWHHGGQVDITVSTPE